MICDLAETYGIFEYRNVPVRLLKVLVWGLRGNSRTKLKLAESDVPTDTILLAAIADSLSFIAWSKTKDGMKNKNRPKAITPYLIGKPAEETAEVFESGDAFERARAKLIGGKADGNTTC